MPSSGLRVRVMPLPNAVPYMGDLSRHGLYKKATALRYDLYS